MNEIFWRLKNHSKQSFWWLKPLRQCRKLSFSRQKCLMLCPCRGQGGQGPDRSHCLQILLFRVFSGFLCLRHFHMVEATQIRGRCWWTAYQRLPKISCRLGYHERLNQESKCPVIKEKTFSSRRGKSFLLPTQRAKTFHWWKDFTLDFNRRFRRFRQFNHPETHQ